MHPKSLTKVFRETQSPPPQLSEPAADTREPLGVAECNKRVRGQNIHAWRASGCRCAPHAFPSFHGGGGTRGALACRTDTFKGIPADGHI